MQYTPNLQSLLRNLNKASAFIDWLRDEGDSLIASATLLGGAKWAKRARTVVARARAGDDTASWGKDLHALRRLLHLEFADTLGSEEAYRFAAIHPDDPRADEARHCAEAVDRGVRALEALRLSGLTNVRGAA
ncbi:hypothetical protein U879_18665 [Defluviimonas sp. 20V17]|uniref:Uncharacterized protein n=1 Tax=Allgaiera indica TaxID=765699 RepID=A0AAN4USB0_9RHOB|nr:hypothetical protein [Allgaiera indica]KDB02158.1 hypothetical protein U879_18665 [Defluviimonas sp. 20V17]GHE02638.1 hypothetical protein GCM10008024_22980 [Allgaiera indica]SDX19929.1 hypothetical protein SAMN05444006_111130 [Allgaiera indica]